MTSTPPLRLLVLSIGGMIGQNILDALKGRRDNVHLIGSNSETGSARNFQCDKVHLTPPTTDMKAFLERLTEIIELEAPDLVLPGRDEDLVALASLRESHPEWRGLFPCGPQKVLRVIQDKWESFRFAQTRGLRFADSALGRQGAISPELESLVARHGFPILAKPRAGWGSKDVFFVQSLEQLRRLTAKGDFLFQEVLDPLPDLSAWAERLAFGIPLGFSLPENRLYAAQTLITPGGDITRICMTVNRMVLGRPEWSAPAAIPALEGLAHAYATAIAALGWVGPFNLQCKQLKDGSFAAFEMNGRFTSSTSTRLRFGHDELGALVGAFIGPNRLPDWNGPLLTDRWVAKSLKEDVILASEVGEFSQRGVWEPQ